MISLPPCGPDMRSLQESIKQIQVRMINSYRKEPVASST